MKMVRLALRWLLILATAPLLAFSGLRPGLDAFTVTLLLAFAASNVALSFLPETWFRSHKLDSLVVVADTVLISLALFHVGPGRGHLLLVFFLTLLLTVLGADLTRAIVGVTLVGCLYLYLDWGNQSGGTLAFAAFLLRLPFLYVTGLYYGHLAAQSRLAQNRLHSIEHQKRAMETFLDVTSATTSTLDLHEVLYIVVTRIARLVNVQRCSILRIDERADCCMVLASSDDRAISGLKIDLEKYPEVRKAITTRRAVVINDVDQEPILDEVREQLMKLGFNSLLVVPIVCQDSLLGMLFLRAVRVEQPFSSEEIATCQIIANASANAIKNATLFEQMRLEAGARKKSADKLQNILDHFPDLIYTTDTWGRMTEFSRGGEELLGLNREQAIGLSYTDLYPEVSAREQLENLLREGVPIRHFETTVCCQDGSMREVMVAASLLRDEAGRPCGTVGIIKNITELKAAQRNLTHSEKLSTIGKILSGVAHELNNPLCGVLGFSQLLMARHSDGPMARELDTIYECALRCQKVVKNLLSFAREHKPERKYLGINGIIKKALEMKKYQLHVNNIEVVQELEHDLARTMLDFHQMQQVFLNVIINAQHAMGLVRDRPGRLVVRTSQAEGMIRAEFIDNGEGMAPDTLQRIFDPFFTTKEQGEGTGLGLSVSYGIVKEHGGRICARSRKGEGSIFVVELPVENEEEKTKTEVSESPDNTPTPSTRGSRVLVVDDEPAIVDLMLAILAEIGCNVDTAANGNEALGKIRSHRYDLLVIDIRMPQMNGMELYRNILHLRPKLEGKIIFITGDLADKETGRFLAGVNAETISKPLDISEVMEMIQKKLGSARRRAVA
jgi:PAS domain S-box-containing protein